MKKILDHLHVRSTPLPRAPARDPTWEQVYLGFDGFDVDAARRDAPSRRTWARGRRGGGAPGRRRLRVGARHGPRKSPPEGSPSTPHEGLDIRESPPDAYPSRGRREAPVILPGSGGELIEGVVDLAFRERGPEGAGWVVVDFKTDSEIAGRKARYESQVLLYVEAIQRATGERARGVLLSV